MKKNKHQYVTNSQKKEKRKVRNTVLLVCLIVGGILVAPYIKKAFPTILSTVEEKDVSEDPVTDPKTDPVITDSVPAPDLEADNTTKEDIAEPKGEDDLLQDKVKETDSSEAPSEEVEPKEASDSAEGTKTEASKKEKKKKKKKKKADDTFKYSFGYVTNGKTEPGRSWGNEAIVFQYFSGEKESFESYENRAAEMASVIKSFMDANINSSMGEYDKEKAIHDYLVQNVHYSYVRRREGNRSQKYEAYGALVNQEAVCEGYAKAFELMCACCGLKCYCVSGQATNDRGTDGHAWNIVQIDGKWHHVDVTWDDPTPERYQNGIDHTYFNVSDSFISQDHSWEEEDYPKCPD